MNGQLEAHIALDDIHAGVQRVRDVVVAAETYGPEALHESLRPLMQDNTHDFDRSFESHRLWLAAGTNGRKCPGN
jgi:hypothetical protein